MLEDTFIKENTVSTDFVCFTICIYMFVYRLYVTTLEAGFRHFRVRDLVRKKLGTFEENSTVPNTKLL